MQVQFLYYLMVSLVQMHLGIIRQSETRMLYFQSMVLTVFPRSIAFTIC